MKQVLSQHLALFQYPHVAMNLIPRISPTSTYRVSILDRVKMQSRQKLTTLVLLSFGVLIVFVLLDSSENLTIAIVLGFCITTVVRKQSIACSFESSFGYPRL